MLIFGINRLIGAPWLFLLGFRYRREGCVRYWIRDRHCQCARRAPAKRSEALLFFHGISIGLVSYFQFLIRFRHETTVLVELPWVTFNPFTTSVPKADDFCNSIVSLLDANQISTACLSSHSYGSFMVGWLLFFPGMAGRVSRVVLVSAPALCLFLPKTCRTVVYDKPHWFEFSLANLFYRNFFWYQSMMTAEDLPTGSVVVLMERDELIPVTDVVKDCEEHGVLCHVIPRLAHGFELFWPLACGKIVRFIRQGTPLGHKVPPKDGEDVKLFFHNARNSELYGRFVRFSLDLLDAIAGRFYMGGHSPYNLQMLSYLDELWRGRAAPKDSVQEEDLTDGPVLAAAFPPRGAVGKSCLSSSPRHRARGSRRAA